MLTLRLQRTGRKKLPQYRLVAQEHRVTPSSGKVSAYLGNYNPHTKELSIDKEAVQKHLANGAQPSNRVAILLQKAGVKLPKWVTITQKPEKKKPAQTSEEVQADKEEPATEEATVEQAADEETPAQTEETAEAEAPAEEPATEETAPEESAAEAEATADEESK